jgi:hypothetical protein
LFRREDNKRTVYNPFDSEGKRRAWFPWAKILSREASGGDARIGSSSSRGSWCWPAFGFFVAGPDGAPRTPAMREFYGRRRTAEIHIPWLFLGSPLIFLHSFTLFPRHRLLFGRIARPWTIAAAILFILLAVITGLAAFGGYVGAFM